MFPIETTTQAKDLAELQYGLLDISAQLGMYDYRIQDWRIFYIPVSRNAPFDSIVEAYLSTLSDMGRFIVTSLVASSAEDRELPIAVPSRSSSLAPFFMSRSEKIDGAIIEMQPLYSDLIKNAVNFVTKQDETQERVSKEIQKLISGICFYHAKNQIKSPRFCGYIDGNILRTIRARLNRRSWKTYKVIPDDVQS